jgi:hypothetical protein
LEERVVFAIWNGMSRPSFSVFTCGPGKQGDQGARARYYAG